MKHFPFSLILLTLFLCPAVIIGQTTEYSLDSNTAFYEGESLNYVIYPPRNYRMVTDEAKIDGYSFAFVPDSQEYAAADVTIGVNIYKIRGIKFKKIVRDDTASIRKHYGKGINIHPVDSIFNFTGHILTTLYIDDETRFLPNVLISYFDGNTEVVIFELLISENSNRPKAEDLFVDCIARFKALKRGTLGMR